MQDLERQQQPLQLQEQRWREELRWLQEPLPRSLPRLQHRQPVIYAPPPPVHVRFGLRVRFHMSESLIDAKYDKRLQDAAAFMKNHSDTMLKVTGHIDIDPTLHNDDALSHNRANMVRDRLIKLGVNPARITTSLSSKDRLLSNNTTEEGQHRSVFVEAEAPRIGDEPMLQGDQ